MSDSAPSAGPAITLEGVSKTYRLYERPGYRLLDLFGLCPSGPSYYREHQALVDITCTIRTGEKVAIIGRNGAGKSTLLKIITGTLQHTSGRVDVRGRLSPLLQIGTGFHTDFTGRQNVYASLAHMGVVGRAADQCFDEVVDFSELEAFIDQPMKTYSTGMAARLMFSTATAVSPEILVIDELLGVGDAYFSHKSFERMRRMCEGEGTTLLLVTHDIYAALNLCERFLWIDRGRIQFEGDGRGTIAAYEASIKAQEEERLRRRHAVTVGQPAGVTGLIVRVRSRSGFALPAPLSLAALALGYEDGREVRQDVAVGSQSWLQLPEGNLGAPTSVEGRACRNLEPYGSIYHKAEWAVVIPDGSGFKEFSAEWRYDGDAPAELLVTTQDHIVLLRAELTSGEAWQRKVWPLGESAPSVLESGGQYGTGTVRMTDVRWCNGGAPVDDVRHGDRLTLEVDYEVMTAADISSVTFLVNLQKAGATSGATLGADDLILAGRAGTIRATIDPVELGSGTWFATIGIGRPRLFEEPFVPYFTVNPAWHHFVARGWELKVVATAPMDPWAFVRLPGKLDCVTRELAPPRG